LIGWWNSGARKTFAAAAAAAARAPDLLLLVLYERHCFARFSSAVLVGRLRFLFKHGADELLKPRSAMAERNNRREFRKPRRPGDRQRRLRPLRGFPVGTR